MTALSDLTTRIASEIDRTDATTQIGYAISTAVAAYKTTRFAFNEKSDTFSTAPGTVEYGTAEGLPTGVVSLDTVRLTTSSSSRYLLEQVSYAVIDALDVSGTYYSRPLMYAWHEEKLRMYPVADTAYTVTLRFLSDVPEETWCDRAEALIRCRAKRELYTHFLFDPQMAQMMAVAEADELRSLKREARLKQASGRVVPHD